MLTAHRFRDPGTRQRVWLAALIAGWIILVAVPPSFGQLVVHDAATTARNATTAALSENLYQLQRLQHDKILQMARRLSALTNLRKYALTNVPLWRSHSIADLFFAGPYLAALSVGDPNGVAYSRLVETLEQSARLAQLSVSARRTFGSRMALVDLADAAAIAGIQTTGQMRRNGQQSELQVIEALERDVIDPSTTQSTTAVLDKISGATLVGVREGQARIQLLTAVLEQLLVDNKQTRDAEAAALNMQLVRWRLRRAADEAFVAGSGGALRSWRQP